MIATQASVLDRRLNAFRSDLADVRLRGRVEAARFVEGEMGRIACPVADVRSRPSTESGLSTQFLLGDEVRVFERSDGFAWVQSMHDSYVGYVALSALAKDGPTPTHSVRVARTFVYPGPDLKLPRRDCLSLGSAVAVTDLVENRGTRYAAIGKSAFLVASHLGRVAEPVEDYVSVAETLTGTPYLWGGTSAFGIDCSGLVQLSMRLAGHQVPRDSDMQAGGIGHEFEPEDLSSDLRRGDLVFWKGHVGIMADGENLLHANGHTMMVSRENVRDAIDRIAYLYGQPTGFRRPPEL